MKNFVEFLNENESKSPVEDQVRLVKNELIKLRDMLVESYNKKKEEKDIPSFRYNRIKHQIPVIEDIMRNNFEDTSNKKDSFQLMYAAKESDGNSIV